MAPIVTLLLNLVLNYLAENADSIIQAIRDEFLTDQSPPEVAAAIQELGYQPSEENLSKLHEVLTKQDAAAGEKLAKILVNNTTV